VVLLVRILFVVSGSDPGPAVLCFSVGVGLFQEVQSLLLHWKGPDLTTYGELVLEGNFKVHRAKNERTLFLFDRMLMITKRRGEHYVYKAHISVSHAQEHTAATPMRAQPQYISVCLVAALIGRTWPS